MKSISKILSANDIGATGGHQAGILIPKDPRILGFFPTLDERDYNPRCHLVFRDDGAGKWEFAFIYYNNALFSGTRNEYRLTRMTKYIRDAGLEIGDEVILKHDKAGIYHVGYRRKNQPTLTETGVLKLGSGWRVIQFDGGNSMAPRSTLELIPDPQRMIEGLRDTGYEFDTAIADIVDNSIAANATKVDIKVDADVRGNIHVSIADNGDGMDESGLQNAMRYGAKVRPSAASLGKYGLGLKTASTAFARRLSVTSRNSAAMALSMITWDLDHVGKVGKWEVLITDAPDPDAIEHLEEIASSHSGTVVAWSNVDRLLKDYSKPDGKFAKKALDRKTDDLRSHLSMVYQRFLDTKDARAPNVTMTLNGAPVRAWDPFLTGLSEVLAQKDVPAETASGAKAVFTVKAYVLPRREEFADQKAAAAAKLSSDMQGIYIYRENRLIHAADWLDMFQKEPHGTLLRVEFSFDHKLDEAFHLDIKKSQIILNEDIWKWLREEFLPAPRREADRRYREGKQKDISKKAGGGAHDTSNTNIGAREAAAGAGAKVSVIDASTGEVMIENSRGKLKLLLPVSSAARPGEIFVKPVPSLNDGLLFEPAIVDQHKAVLLNTSHPYYEKIYLPNLNRSVTVQGMDSLFWALAIAELSTIDQATIKHFRDMRFEVSKILRTLVESLPEADVNADAA